MQNMLCPICGRGELSLRFLEAKDCISKEKFVLLQCTFCQVKRTYPVPRSLVPYYETEIGLWMRGRANKVYQFFRNIVLLKEIQRITRRIAAKEFLDVGCGSGVFSKILHEKGYRVQAVDSALEKPFSIRNLDIPYYIIDYNDYSIKDFSTAGGEVVILRHVLEHLREPAVFMKKMLLSKGRIFYIVLPNASSLKNKIFRSYNFFLDPPRHLWHFDEKSLRIFFEKLNLRILDFGYDTIPTVIPSLYRFLRIKGISPKIYNYFQPTGIIATLFLPIDWLLPNDMIWFIVKEAQ
jgi:SAM-dependent methyltransferase